MLLLAIILIILFGGLGFAAHVLWIGLILGAVLLVVHMLSGRNRIP